MKPMTYKGYAARIEYSGDDECFVGRIAGIKDVVGFHGDSVAEMRQHFEEAVDDYLATCERLGRLAQQPASGSVLVRMEPELHQAIAARADASGKSMNNWVVEGLRVLVESTTATATRIQPKHTARTFGPGRMVVAAQKQSAHKPAVRRAATSLRGKRSTNKEGLAKK